MALLPFEAEPQETRDKALDGILHNLYITLRSEDFTPGAMFWSRQLQNWLNLKFEMPRSLRARLTTMFYNLALAPGLAYEVSDRFTSMVILLTK